MLNVSLENALELLLQHIKEKEQIEDVSLENALGRVLAENIIALQSNPPFDRSPLDGYAFRAEDSKGATKEEPACLEVIGEVCAGENFVGEVKAGQAVRIMTGAPIPKGCDCVLRQEDTDEGEESVALYTQLKPFDNYCFKGEDIKEGTCIMEIGEKLSPASLGILASIGRQTVKVKEHIKMALICTGDEIVPLGQPLAHGKIYNSNLYMLQARAQQLGIKVIALPQCKDNPEEVAKLIENVSDKVDFIVTTGGVSVGKKDIMHEVLLLLGAKRLFWRVQMQPGTPILGSLVKDKLMVSLSGNPFAALTNFELIVRPVLARLSGDQTIMPQVIEAEIASDFNKLSKKRRFIRASYYAGKVYLNHNQHASGSLHTMHACNCLIDISAGTENLTTGQKVRVVLL